MIGRRNFLKAALAFLAAPAAAWSLGSAPNRLPIPRWSVIGCPDAACIEAVRWDGLPETANRILGESYGTDWSYASPGSGTIAMPDRPGSSNYSRAPLGSYLIRWNNGSFGFWSPRVFEDYFELA